MSADEMGDMFARMQAEADENSAGIRAFAGVVAAFYKGLLDEGFSESAALDLAETWLQVVVESTFGQGGEQ